jgi:ABC-type uncharacterized transport system YnjBCD ATPase subunit
MNDEQRRGARFRAQPEGTGPFFRHPALRCARVDRPHRAQRALTGKKTAAVAATGQLLTDPKQMTLDEAAGVMREAMRDSVKRHSLRP